MLYRHENKQQQGEVGDRGVLQGDQADPPADGLHRHERERGQVADMDRAFSRLVGIVRSAVWMDLDIVETLRLHGIASPKHGGAPPQLWNKTT